MHFFLNYFFFGAGPPRFKQNVRRHVYTYLGDKVHFKCTAIGRPPPKVHWYREGNYLNYSFMHTHERFIEKDMLLEIRQVEIEDKVRLFISSK